MSEAQPASKVEVVFTSHFPVSARSFVLPMVAHLNRVGIASELWVQYHPKHTVVLDQMQEPKRLLDCDLVINPFKLWQRIATLRKQLRALRPRVMHASQTRASLVPLLAAWLESVPCRVYHNQGIPYLGYAGPMRFALRCLEKLNIGLSTHVLLISPSNLRAAREDGLLAPHAGTVIGHGTVMGQDMTEFGAQHFDQAAAAKAREVFGIAGAPFVLGYVGRPHRRKGFHLLLRAWERSRLGTLGNVLLIAGCTSDECAQALGRAVPGVRGLGYLIDMRPFYAACNSVTLPSEHEGFGIAMLEAAAAGRALIGTDIPGLQCAVKNLETGLLVPAKDEAALRAAIERLVGDRQLCETLGKNARLRVERDFLREDYLAALVEFYERDLGVRRSTARPAKAA